MAWYVAICSLVTGFVVGLIALKWADVQALRQQMNEFAQMWIRTNDVYNRNMGRLFDINREILKVHLSQSAYDLAMDRLRTLEMPIDEEE